MTGIDKLSEQCRHWTGSSPLLARLPSIRSLDWAIGHLAALDTDVDSQLASAAGLIVGVPVPVARWELFVEDPIDRGPLRSCIDPIDSQLASSDWLVDENLGIIEGRNLLEPVEQLRSNWLMLIEDRRLGYFLRLTVQCLQQRTFPYHDESAVAQHLEMEIRDELSRGVP